MKKLTLLILLCASIAHSQSDDAFVQFKFLRENGMLRRDSGSIWMSPAMIKKAIGDSAIEILQRVPQGTTQPGGEIDTANLVLSKQNAGENYTKLSDARLSDSRVPRSHSHAESDITGLVTDLGGWIEIQRSADTTLNASNINFVNLGELFFVMEANAVYEITARIWFTKATDASAYTLALNCGGTPTNIGLRAEGVGSATDGTDQLKTSLMNTATDSLQLTAASVGNGKLEHVQIDGQIINQNAANIFQFRWKQEIASSGVTIKRGSYLRYRRLY